MQRYGLIHIIAAGEFNKPLVASQVFDHAQVQAETGGADAPERVAVIAIEPMRVALSRTSLVAISTLRKRCPDLHIRLIGGMGRLDSWPAFGTAARFRRHLFGSLPVVYHCRGESAAAWGQKLRGPFPSDAIVLDVRGAWPLELVYDRGVKDPELTTGRDRDDYLGALVRLRRIVGDVDAVTTVSQPLKDWLVRETDAPPDTAVVPCCVKSLASDDGRNTTRKRWGADGPVFLYSGTTASYQHVEDMVLPFMRGALDVAGDARAVLLTPELETMQRLVEAARLDRQRTIIESLPQSEVASALTGADLGLLVRAPSLLNRFSQPVKLGEYLASGLPVAVEQGTGDVPAMLAGAGAGITVVTSGRTVSDVQAEARRAIDWVRVSGSHTRPSARRLAESEFTWSGVCRRVRELYQRALVRQDAALTSVHVRDRDEQLDVSEAPKSHLKEEEDLASCEY